jgi:hypothetical protein
LYEIERKAVGEDCVRRSDVDAGDYEQEMAEGIEGCGGLHFVAQDCG